jgi:serine/alanine adding enzyme
VPPSQEVATFIGATIDSLEMVSTSDPRCEPPIYSVNMKVDWIEEPGEEWDAFVAATPGSNLGHASAWARVMRDAYGLAPHYLAARDDGGGIAGVLPLVHFRGLRGERELVSLPFLDRAGLLTSHREATEALLAAALDYAREAGARSLELRHDEPREGIPLGPPVDRVDLVLTLERDEDAQWKAIRAKVRNQTRKATKEGLRIAEGDLETLLDGFYQPFCVNMRDLGSPVHHRNLFAAAARCLGDSLRFIVVEGDDGPVGGLVAIHHGDTVSVPWASTLRSERRRCPNNLIYWEALRWAVSREARDFDFGRSPREGGTWRFKKGWGAEERPLTWTRLTPTGTLAPTTHLKSEGMMKHASQIWTRLPVPLTARIGPWLRGRISN